MAGDLTQSQVTDILESIPSPRQVEITPRHTYVVVGKPGSGKSTLASKLAAFTETIYVQPQLTLSKHLADEISPFRTDLIADLESGRQVKEPKVLSMVKSLLYAEDTSYKGYTLDGFPCKLNDPDSDFIEIPVESVVPEGEKTADAEPVETSVPVAATPWMVASPDDGLTPDVRLLHQLLSKKESSHIPILVHLRISDEDLIRRRAAQWIDPVSNLGYSGQQVLYSKRRRNEGYTDGQKDVEALIEAGVDPATIIEGEEEPDAEKSGTALGTPSGGEAAPEDADDEEEETGEDGLQDEAMIAEMEATRESRNKKKPLKPLSLKNKATWPILSAAILDRLVKNPFDDPALVSEELKAFKKYELAIEEIRAKYFNILQVIDLDATLHPDLAFEQVKTRLEMRNYSIFSKPIECKRLPIPEGGFKGMVDSDIVKYYQNLSTDESEPKRDVGDFKKFCPVTFYNDGTLVEGSFNHVAMYRSVMYCFTEEGKADLFASNPDKFLAKKRALPQLKVSVSGFPFTGKTIQAKLLALKYDIAYISIDDVIERLDNEKPENLTKKGDALLTKVATRLKKGGNIPTELLTELIKYALKQAELKGRTAKGWVLDNYPRNAEQAKALIAAGITPKYYVRLQSDVMDEPIALRGKKNKVSRIGKAVDPKDELSSIFPAPYHDKIASATKDDSNELGKAIEESDGILVSVGGDQSIQAVFNQLASGVDPLVPQATYLTGKPSSEGGPPESDLGLTKDFCPVSIKTSNLLIKGNKAYGVKYLGKTFYCVSEETRNAFCVEPYSFIKDIKIPPPRLIVLGPTGSGRSMYTGMLSKVSGVPVVDFRQFIVDYANNLSIERREEVLPYSKEGAMIPSTVLVEILNTLYFQAPYSTSGFLLENFPHSKLDVESAMKNNFIPDAFLVLKIDTEIAAQRALPEKRRELNLLRIADEEKAKLPKVKADPEEKDGKETKTEPEEKSGAVPKYLLTDDELVDDLLSAIEKETTQISEYVSIIEGLSTVPVLEINTSKTQRPVFAQLMRKLRPFLEYRQCLFSSPTATTAKVSDLLLKSGTKYYSPIGKYCPVTIKNGGGLNPSFIGKKPVIMDENVYFLRDNFSKKEFIANPLKYVVKAHPQPIVSPTICIIGNPKAGSTSLASRIAEDLDAVHLTIPGILQAVVEGKEITALHDEISTALEAGGTVPDNAIVGAVLLITSRVINSGRGWVLDGFPLTVEQAKSLEGAGFVPHLVLKLSLDDNHIVERVLSDVLTTPIGSLPQFNTPELVLEFDRVFRAHVGPIKNLFESKFSNWMEMDGNLSKWALKEVVREVLEGGIKKRQTYLDMKSKGSAAPISGIGLSREHVMKNLGKFREFCPVRYIDADELEQSNKPGRPLAEYKERFYYFNSQTEMNTFLGNPEKYIGGKDLPAILPIRRSSNDVKEMFPKQIELRGYCPVTFQRGPKGFDSIVPGHPDCVVEYDDMLFSTSNEETLESFLRTPWKYINLTLPMKLPPAKAPIPVIGLPIVGYLEQTLASTLTKALTAVGKSRPKFPYKNLQDSASEFVGLYLKSHNPKTKTWVKDSYIKRLDTFNETCETMKQVIDMAADQIDYVPVQDRAIDFDAKISKILSFSE